MLESITPNQIPECEIPPIATIYRALQLLELHCNSSLDNFGGFPTQTMSLHGWSRLWPSCLLLPPLSFGLLIFTHMPASRHFWMLIFATFSQLRYPPPSTWISTRTSNSQLSQPSVHRRKNATALCGRTVVCLCVEAAGNTSAISRSGIRGNPTP